MEDSILKQLETGTEIEVIPLLEEFNVKYENQFHSVGLDQEAYRRVWKLVLSILSDASSKYVCLTSLNALRILSRDKTAFNQVIDGDHLNIIMQKANLVSEEAANERLNNDINYEVVIEAQRCLSNMIYNSTQVQRLCCTNSCIPGLMYRLKNFKDPDVPVKIKNFDMRLLFLISAFCADIRPALRTEHHCLAYLIEYLEHILKTQEENLTTLPVRLRIHTKITFDKDSCNLITDMLKVLYNLVLHIDRVKPEEDEDSYCTQLIIMMRSFLLANSESAELTEALHSNAVNLLLVMPPALYTELLQPMPKADSSLSSGVCHVIGGVDSEPDYSIEYDGRDMSAIVRLLEFMHRRLKQQSNPLKETIGPVLTLMTEMCQTHRIIRKFVRLKVLPPLRDVTRRPEEGNSIRSRLCSLMTSPIPDIKQLSANFLFILCRESVDRLIKYTGYGNAAGLLASRGLMMGRRHRVVNYSSESEDSDTEEYERMKDKVNPVTGVYEPPRPSPLENMTEEQKEYEAMKLMNALDKLSRDKVIQPCRVGEDGRPQPMESVLQLQEGISELQPERQSEEDSPNENNI